jgi:DNA-3-methyladenine glycosylase II
MAASLRCAAVARIRSYDAEMLGEATEHLARVDARLGRVIAAHGPCDLEPRGDPYRYLVRSILYQQLAGSAAASIERRFKRAFGGRIPAPHVLAAARAPRLRALGLSRQKAVAVKAVAAAFGDGLVQARRLPYLADEAVVEAVTQIHGVGEWTAHMLLMFSLGRPDVLPVGDYGVRKGAQKIYGLRELPKPGALEEIASPWRPFRTVGAYYLWRALEIE